MIRTLLAALTALGLAVSTGQTACGQKVDNKVHVNLSSRTLFITNGNGSVGFQLYDYSNTQYRIVGLYVGGSQSSIDGPTTFLKSAVDNIDVDMGDGNDICYLIGDSVQFGNDPIHLNGDVTIDMGPGADYVKMTSFGAAGNADIVTGSSSSRSNPDNDTLEMRDVRFEDLIVDMGAGADDLSILASDMQSGYTNWNVMNGHVSLVATGYCDLRMDHVFSGKTTYIYVMGKADMDLKWVSAWDTLVVAGDAYADTIMMDTCSSYRELIVLSLAGHDTVMLDNCWVSDSHPNGTGQLWVYLGEGNDNLAVSNSNGTGAYVAGEAGTDELLWMNNDFPYFSPVQFEEWEIE